MPSIPSFPELTVGTAARRGSVTVLPLFATTALPVADYDLGTDAVVAGHLQIHELPRGATVSSLQARNRSRRRVLLVEGDHLVGARQNRMLTSSALIGGKREVELPVSCVERGRWDGASQFAADATTGSSCGAGGAVHLARWDGPARAAICGEPERCAKPALRSVRCDALRRHGSPSAGLSSSKACHD